MTTEDDLRRLENKLQQHRTITEQIKMLEQQKKALSQEILASWPTATKKVSTAHYSVSRQKNFSIKTSLDDARLFDAVKIEEVIDRARLREIYKSGTPVPGISATEYVLVTSTQSTAQNL